MLWSRLLPFRCSDGLGEPCDPIYHDSFSFAQELKRYTGWVVIPSACQFPGGCYILLWAFMLWGLLEHTLTSDFSSQT